MTDDTTTTPAGATAGRGDAEAISKWLSDYVSKLVNLPVAEINPETTFDRYGLDSAASVGLVADLEESLNRNLDPTLLYDYPTITALSTHLATSGGSAAQ